MHLSVAFLLNTPDGIFFNLICSLLFLLFTNVTGLFSPFWDYSSPILGLFLSSNVALGKLWGYIKQNRQMPSPTRLL